MAHQAGQIVGYMFLYKQYLDHLCVRSDGQGTPILIVQNMSEIFSEMADDPELVEAVRKVGASTVKSTPAQFRAQIQHEIKQWKPFLREWEGEMTLGPRPWFGVIDAYYDVSTQSADRDRHAKLREFRPAKSARLPADGGRTVSGRAAEN